MKAKSWEYDFFIAHASGDVTAAEELYKLLTPKSRAFLDKEDLLPGDNWNSELAAAQRNSRVTVVLVSSRSGAAYYESEEIAAAISLARGTPETHRVVPVYLEAVAESEVPYGLRIKHSLDLTREGGMPGVAARLLKLLEATAHSDNTGRAPGPGPVSKTSNSAGGAPTVRPGQTVVRCARCQGTGTKDRDGRPPTCSVCDGGGYIAVNVGKGTFVKCGFCGGDGTRDRDGHDPTCPVCSGVGGFAADSDALPCAACQGTGSRDRDGKPPICEACGGRGVRALGALRTY